MLTYNRYPGITTTLKGGKGDRLGGSSPKAAENPKADPIMRSTNRIVKGGQCGYIKILGLTPKNP